MHTLHVLFDEFWQIHTPVCTMSHLLAPTPTCHQDAKYFHHSRNLPHLCPFPGNHFSDFLQYRLVLPIINFISVVSYRIYTLLGLVSHPQQKHDVLQVLHVFASVFLEEKRGKFCPITICLSIFLLLDIWVTFHLSRFKWSCYE